MDDPLLQLLTDTTDIGRILDCLDWSEDEIQAAMCRHPHAADRLWHSNMLLRTNGDRRLSTEWVFRAHCRELLDRVAADEDTRPATDAEICCAILEIASLTPVRTAPFGLLVRLWHRTFPDRRIMRDDEIAHYESIRGEQISDLEQESRSKLADNNRALGAITCTGKHHGKNVNCTYAPSST